MYHDLYYIYITFYISFVSLTFFMYNYRYTFYFVLFEIDV